MRQLTKLFEPIKLGQIEVKNRFVLLAMGTSYSIDEKVNDRLKAFFVERAKGGAGLLLLPALPVPENGRILPRIYDDDSIPAWRQVTKEIHAHDAKTFVQLLARWDFAVDKDKPAENFAPSPIATRRNVPPPKELTIEQIHQLIEAFANAARRAREAGFDGVELMGGMGYLINRFVSSCTNKRTDDYGGSLEKRARFLLEIIDKTKKLVGQDFPLQYRMSADEFMAGGNTIEDSKKIAQIVEKAGVVAINVCAGFHESPKPLTQTSVPRGSFIYLAHEIKKVVKIPVIGAFRINDPILAEDILLQGKADMIGMARALIADPYLPQKAKEGRYEDIIPCIACSRCIQTTWLEQTGLECSVNPRAGREDIIPARAPSPRKVLVIGGGPGGMEAATIAAQRGHKVKLYEKDSFLGGQLVPAGKPPYKSEITYLTRYLITQLKKSGAEVNLSTEINARFVLKQKPDIVIVATGAEPSIPDIPGAKGKNVIDPLKVIAGEPTGARVVVVGGGLIGCETAELLAYQGKKVSLTSRQAKIGTDISRTHRWTVIQRLNRANIEMYPNSQPLEITENGIKLARNGENMFIWADTIVLAGGMKAVNNLAKELEGKVSSVYTVGDCVNPSNIARAINDAFLLACKV